MANDITFVLDTKEAEQLLTTMSLPLARSSAEAMAGRARSMVSSMSSEPIEITVESAIGTIKRGSRAVATIRAIGQNAHQNYIGHVALAKSKDAGKI